MWEQLFVEAVEVTLDSGVSGLGPLRLVPLDDSSGLGQPDDLDALRHVSDQLVVHALLVKHQNHVHFEGLRDVFHLKSYHDVISILKTLAKGYTSFQRQKWPQTKMHTNSDIIFGHSFSCSFTWCDPFYSTC